MWAQLLLILPMVGAGEARVLMKQEETLTQVVQRGHYRGEQILLQVGIFDDYPGCWLPDVGAIPVYQPCKWVARPRFLIVQAHWADSCCHRWLGTQE